MQNMTHTPNITSTCIKSSDLRGISFHDPLDECNKAVRLASFYRQMGDKMSRIMKIFFQSGNLDTHKLILVTIIFLSPSECSTLKN